MSDVDSVLELSQKLETLKRRVAEIDAERASLVDEIARCMSQLGTVTRRHIAPPTNASVRERVLWVLNRYAETNRGISPQDLAAELGVRSGTDRQTLRGMLARLTKEGKVRRYAHGRYQLVK